MHGNLCVLAIALFADQTCLLKELYSAKFCLLTEFCLGQFFIFCCFICSCLPQLNTWFKHQIWLKICLSACHALIFFLQIMLLVVNWLSNFCWYFFQVNFYSMMWKSVIISNICAYFYISVNLGLNWCFNIKMETCMKYAHELL